MNGLWQQHDTVGSPKIPDFYEATKCKNEVDTIKSASGVEN
jgi:hypothetical protein